MMRVVNSERNQVLIEAGHSASTPWARLRGLLGRSLGKGEGLILLGTKGIHTMGMHFPIDVLFLDEHGQVVHLIHALQPFRISPFVKHSVMVLELSAGVLRETGTKIGDSIFVVLCGD